MSSAKIRSHRSYRNKVSTAEQFQRRQYVKGSQKKIMEEHKGFFAKLMGLFKKGDK